MRQITFVITVETDAKGDKPVKSLSADIEAQLEKLSELGFSSKTLKFEVHETNSSDER